MFSITKKMFFTLIMLFTFMQIFSIYRAPEGSRYYFWTYSASLLSMGMGLGGTENPSGSVINPAGTGFVQNFKVEVSYAIAPAFWVRGEEESFQSVNDFFLPLIGNAGFILPTKYGNFTGYFHYTNSSGQGFGVANNNDQGIGREGAFYLGFSKDYNDNFSFGFSGNLKFSYNPLRDGGTSNFDVGGAIDIGLIYKPDWSFPVSQKAPGLGAQDFQFSLLLKELGKPLMNYKQADWVLGWGPLPFTPGLGFSCNLFNNGTTHWKILSDLSFPFFQNVVGAVGTEIQIAKFVVLKGSFTADLEGILEYTGVVSQYEYMYNIFNFAGGISFKFSSDTFKNRTKSEVVSGKSSTSEFSIDIGAKPYHNGMIFDAGFVVQIGRKDSTPPEVKYIQKDFYASPNMDGVQDKINIALDIKDERYIREWRLEIYDSSRKIVRTIANKEDRQDGLTFKSVVKKYFSPKKGVYVPSNVDWDCRDDKGNVVPDGVYYYKFFAMDDNRNANNGTQEGKIEVDTDSPDIKSTVTNTIFSPNNDGNKDTLVIDVDIIKSDIGAIFIPIDEFKLEDKVIIPQEKEVEAIKDEAVSDGRVTEQVWNVEILDASGKVVKTTEYKEKGKKKLEWDGKDASGNQMPDGVYTVRLSSRDLAGNKFEKFITNIIINTEPTPIEATVINSIFSPNMDSVNDEVSFKFNIPNKKGVEKWEFTVLDGSKKSVKKFTGINLPPDTMKWDGKNENGAVTPEGDYTGKLTLVYENGNSPAGVTPKFTVDLTPPAGRVVDYTKIFSPNGDGNKDSADFTLKSSQENDWYGVIYDKNGKEMKSYIWKSQVPEKFQWNGKDNQGKVVSDGDYSFVLQSKDSAGNSFKSEKYPIKIDTENMPLALSFVYDEFSPNGDKVKDIEVFDVITKDAAKNVVKWTLDILNDKGSVVNSYTGKDRLPESLMWDGKSSKGVVASDGFYTAKLESVYESGNVSAAKTSVFVVDNTAPSVDIKSLKNVFSPNGDGFLDAFTILQKGSKEDLWSVSVSDQTGKEVWRTSYVNSQPAAKELWNGRDMDGNIQKNGLYTYAIKSEDKAGNVGRSVIDKFELKNVYTSVFLTINNDKFSPNGDSVLDNIEFVPFVSVKNDIDLYQIDILDKSGKSVKVFKGESAIPDKIVWDGKGNDGNLLIDGVYSAKMTAAYSFGNMPVIESSQFYLDTTPPGMKLKYVPDYFSPDNDNNDDELTINVSADDLSGVNEWKITVMNPLTGKEFVSFNGSGKPAESFKWNGLGLNGDVVESAEDYPVVIYAKDNAGNELRKDESPIAVDILVIKLPDGRLKIKISNIEFKPDSAEMTDSVKNAKVIKMLARALKKYGNYRITIEGHANKFQEGLDGKKAKDLSDLRAKAIMDKMKELGIAQMRMNAVGKGFDEPLVPLAPGVDKDELAKNRRVEFYLKKE